MRVKINVGIFGLLAIVFAVIPNVLFRTWFPNDGTQPQYAGQFVYVLHDICPCQADDDECAGYYACGSDKANITYNLDTAPEDLLAEAKRDHYFEGMIEANRQGFTVMRLYLLCDISYLMAFISLVAGVVYWNHCRTKKW